MTGLGVRLRRTPTARPKVAAYDSGARGSRRARQRRPRKSPRSTAAPAEVDDDARILANGYMSLSEIQQNLIGDLTLGPTPKITLDEFCARWPIAPSSVGTLACSILDQAHEEMDARGVAYGFMLAMRSGEGADWLQTMIPIALEPWHRSHEDMVFFMADLRRPECLDVFAKLVFAKFDYLASDDARALAVKCIWGMGKLGTADAVLHLTTVLNSAEPILSRNAADQLKRISERGVEPAASMAARALVDRPPQSQDVD